MNTKLRAKAENNFEKEFFKLMNNSVFGKMMGNIQKYKDIKLITNAKDYLKAVMKPNFKSGILFGENLMGCERGKVKVVMNKPVYLSQALLDLSKIVMYKFHYDYMIPKYGDNLKLCYMDTNSLIYDIQTEDFYADIADDVLEKFDTSGYVNDRPLPIGKNKKVIGTFPLIFSTLVTYFELCSDDRRPEGPQEQLNINYSSSSFLKGTMKIGRC